MSDETSVTESENNAFVNPETFHAELAKIAEGIEEPEAKEEPAEEIVEEEEAAPEADEEEEDLSKPVPPKRLKKEIERRKESDSRYQQERDERIKVQRDLDNLNETIKKYMQPEKQAEASEDEEIDALDPETTSKLQKQINELKKQLTTKDEKDTQKEAQNYFANSLHQHQQEFEKSTPDFGESYKFLLNSTYNEFIAAGYDVESAKAGTMKSLTEKAAVAFQQGKNTAAVAYQLAKARGYAPKGKAPTQKTGPDLGKIAENMGKSTSLAEVAEASTAGSGSYDGVDALSKLATKPGGFIDGKKFAALLEKERRNN